MKKQVLFKTTISLFLIMFFIGGFMSLHSQENFLENEFFEEWDNGDPSHWETSAQASQSLMGEGLVGDYALYFEHTFGGPYDDDQAFTHVEADGQEATYYGEIWVKGHGDIRVGINRPGYGTHDYSDWQTIDTEEWIKITHETIKDDRAGTEGNFRIQHRQSEEKDDTELLVGATWLSTQESPGNWPEPLASISVSPDEVYEDESFNETFTLTLTEEEFVVNLDSGDINLGGDFDGLNIADVTRVNNTKATVQLAGNLSHNTGEGQITVESSGLEGEKSLMAVVGVSVVTDNFISNWHFDEWTGGEPDEWEWNGADGRLNQNEDNPLAGLYNVSLTPISSRNRLTQYLGEKFEANETYHGAIWAKSTDNVKAQVGIRWDGNNAYGDYTELNDNEWTKITYTRERDVAGTDDALIISIVQSDEGDQPPVIVGAAWLADEPPPANWPTVMSHTVSFNVTDGTDPIEDAEISIEGIDPLTTDADGEATIDLADGTYTYDVTADGFEDIEGETFEVDGAEETVNVTMTEPKHLVTFTVTYDNDSTPTAIDGAEITIKGVNESDPLETDANGEATIELSDDTYTYGVTADGFDDIVDAEFTVVGEAEDVDVTMTEEVVEHTVELTSLNGNGSVEVDGQTLDTEGQSVDIVEGTNITITPDADPGWEFDSWSVDADDETEESFDVTIDSNYDIGVTFVPKTYTLTLKASPEAGGSVEDLTDDAPYKEDAEVEIKATVNEGYAFAGWTAVNGEFEDANAAQTTFIMPANDATVTANFNEATNLLQNGFFENWLEDGEQPEHWTGSHSFGNNWNKNSEYVKVGNYSVEVDGEGERTLDQRDMEEVVTEQYYYAEVWVKGTGDIRIGITYPSSSTNYNEWVTLDNDEWTKISHEATTAATDGDDGGIRIRTNDDGGNTPEETIYIGAAWLGEGKPPEEWPSVPTYTVSFSVEDEEESPIENATISIEGFDDITTDSDGEVEIDLTNGEYSYDIFKSGYITQTDLTFEVAGEDKSIDITMIEEGDKYQVTFTVIDDADLAIQDAEINIDYLADNLTTGTEGKATIDLENGNYTYEVSKDGFETKSDDFEVDGEEKNVDITLVESVPETATNLLQNGLFEDWIENDEQPEHWTGSHAFGNNWHKNSEYVKVGDYSVEVDGEGERTLNQRDMEEVVTEQYYYAEVWVKGTGEAEIGITYPSGHTSWIDDVITLDDSEWTKISHEATTAATDGDDGGIRIRTNDNGGNTPEETIYIGAAWLGEVKPPEEWPYIPNYTVSFSVEDEDETPIKSAKISIEEYDDITTDDEGKAEIELPNGEYVFNVSKEGYANQTGLAFEVDGEDYNVPTITLQSAYELILVAEPEDGGNVEGEGVYGEGEEITVTAIAAENWEFINWTKTDGEEVSDLAEFYYTMPAKDITLTANFEDVTAIMEQASAETEVFPNPATNSVTVKSDEMIKNIKLINISGQAVKEVNVEDFSYEMNINNLQTGIYFMQIHTEEDVVTERVQITR